MLLSDWWGVPKGCKNKDLAMKFIQHACQAKYQAMFANIIPYSPANPKAFDFISKERSTILPTSPENIKLVIPGNEDWWGANFTAMEERWKAWMLK
jgi:putative spermidine/putrescine transport system substrate-binding protein